MHELVWLFKDDLYTRENVFEEKEWIQEDRSVFSYSEGVERNPSSPKKRQNAVLPHCSLLLQTLTFGLTSFLER